MFDTERSAYAFQISMNDVEVMHILQAIRNINQLKVNQLGSYWGQARHVQAQRGLHVDPSQ